ncbi:MAG: DUF1302 family protein [Pseudomonadota bacterium]
MKSRAKWNCEHLVRGLNVAFLVLFAGAVDAGQVKIPFIGDTPIDLVYNSTFIAGVAVRAEPQDKSTISKNNLDPEVCGRTGTSSFYQACQGLFTGQTFAAEHLAAAPGSFSPNFDQGNINYEQWDLAQGLLRINQDVTFGWKDWFLFAKAIAIYDPVNYRFKQTHPNLITDENLQDVGYTTFPGSIALPVGGARTDSTPCPANRNPLSLPCGIVYGPGGRVERSRGSRVDREIGLGIQLLDINITGSINFFDQLDVAVRLGKQQVIWGEATLQFFDSINVLNPPDLNNFFRVGGNGLDDFYQPLNAFSFGTNPTDNTNISGWYALEFRPVELPAYGGFYSPVNLGTLNEGPDYVSISFGNLTPDEDGVGRLIDNPLTLITNTTSRAERLRDDNPKDIDNNYGLKLSYTADWLNNGTNLGFYFANYTSRIPIVSVFSADEACSKNSTSTAEFLNDCPDIPVLHQPLNDPAGATDSALSLDTVKVQLEYPRNIKMFGFSFNTSFGDVSFQGEVAYRPHDPLQVDIVDLVFAGLGPTLTNCHLAPGCTGSTAGSGTQANGLSGVYPSSNFTTAEGAGAFPDTFDLAVGHLPGSGRSFPNFIIPYRGGTLGTNPANSYIRGYEKFKTLSLDFGATYVEGNTDFTARLLGADQVIWLPEIGIRYVGIPHLEELALAVPGTFTSPTAGADGSGADGSQQACSSNQACVFGADGLRFNPHQAPLNLYPTKFSGGLGFVWLIRWENVLPDISIAPQIIFKHDLFGHSPGYLSNYVEGRTLWDTNIEMRYRDKTSFNIGYQLWSGAGNANLFRDRDTIKAFAKYSF